MSTIAQGRAQLAQAMWGVWTVDPAHSRLEFALPYMTGTFRGAFSPFEATLEVPEEGAATLTGVARVEDVRVQDENLEAHLQSPDFFDAERSPELRFTSTDVRLEDEQVVARGELTIRDVTRPVELRGTAAGPFVDGYGRERVGLELETVVDRTEFGLSWNMPLPSGEPALPRDVTLAAELYFVRA